ncbi:MAG TPA: class I SAM-dependent methyltransferase [Herpetosiphonaceae bacterium]
MSAEYDAVADQYDATFQALPYRIYVEEWSVLQVLGDVTGRSVLELATGTGHYARRLRKLGAAKVVAVDLSPEMIAMARAAEEQAPLGNIEYHVGDVAALDLGETFDVVLAVYLLHYAPNQAALDAMAGAIARHLKPGGRFVTYQLNPDISRDEEYYVNYGLRNWLPERLSDGQQFSFSARVGDTWWPPLTVYWWSQDSLTAALERAGLANIRWHRPSANPTPSEAHGPEHWQAYIDVPHCMLIEAIKA